MNAITLIIRFSHTFFPHLVCISHYLAAQSWPSSRPHSFLLHPLFSVRDTHHGFPARFILILQCFPKVHSSCWLLEGSWGENCQEIFLNVHCIAIQAGIISFCWLSNDASCTLQPHTLNRAHDQFNECGLISVRPASVVYEMKSQAYSCTHHTTDSLPCSLADIHTVFFYRCGQPPSKSYRGSWVQALHDCWHSFVGGRKYTRNLSDVSCQSTLETGLHLGWGFCIWPPPCSYHKNSSAHPWTESAKEKENQTHFSTKVWHSSRLLFPTGASLRDAINHRLNKKLGLSIFFFRAQALHQHLLAASNSACSVHSLPISRQELLPWLPQPVLAELAWFIGAFARL